MMHDLGYSIYTLICIVNTIYVQKYIYTIPKYVQKYIYTIPKFVNKYIYTIPKFVHKYIYTIPKYVLLVSFHQPVCTYRLFSK